MASQLYTTQVTIPAAGSITAAPIGVDNVCLVGIVMPAGWTAAALTFQGSADGSAFANMYDNNGAEVTIQAAASRYIVVPPLSLVGLKSINVRSGTSGTPVTQGSAQTMTFVFRPFF